MIQKYSYFFFIQILAFLLLKLISNGYLVGNILNRLCFCHIYAIFIVVLIWGQQLGKMNMCIYIITLWSTTRSSMQKRNRLSMYTTIFNSEILLVDCSLLSLKIFLYIAVSSTHIGIQLILKTNVAQCK